MTLPHLRKLLSETAVWRLQAHTIPFTVDEHGTVLGFYRGQLVNVRINDEFAQYSPSSRPPREA